jgi:hypothetical protein
VEAQDQENIRVVNGCRFIDHEIVHGQHRQELLEAGGHGLTAAVDPSIGKVGRVVPDAILGPGRAGGVHPFAAVELERAPRNHNVALLDIHRPHGSESLTARSGGQGATPPP